MLVHEWMQEKLNSLSLRLQDMYKKTKQIIHNP